MLTIIYIFTILIALGLIFIERRSVNSTIAWVIVLLMFPIGGLAVYMLFGRRFLKDKKLFLKKNEDAVFRELALNTSDKISSLEGDNVALKHMDLVKLFDNLGSNNYTSGNKVELYSESNEYFESLKNALKNAKRSINIQFYIFKDDNLGTEIIEILEEKQQSGVRVKVLYDAMGSRSLNPDSFSKLVSYGGEVAAFLPSKIKPLNLNINYRNHRKLVIIDGGYTDINDDIVPVGYIGGFNIGDEYIGKYEHFGEWRDTHIKVLGPAIKHMNLRFLLDWRFASGADIDLSEYLKTNIEPQGDVSMQIVSSGPDTLTEDIKYGYTRMIQSANKYVYIQSPYLILDASLLESLKMACYRGVDVRIMLPSKPDHPFVYWANRSYAGELLKVGAKIYYYSNNAFLHAKTVVMDDEVCSIGTANMDIRSFCLNFEVNSFMYSGSVSISQRIQFEEDIKCSTELTLDEYEERGKGIKVRESISRLLSPIL